MNQRMRQGSLPDSLRAEHRDGIAILTLNRPHKRNAIDEEMIAGIHTFFSTLPDSTRSVLVHGEGEHFSAGLDFTDLGETDATQGVMHSRSWHRTFDLIQFAEVPVIAVLKGAVVGGGLELASACHLRVAEESTFYALPEGQRGLFVGGGASVRVPRLIGVARMADMMLTGRTYGAAEGLTIGLSQYLVQAGQGLAKGLELAGQIAKNARLTNFAILHVLPQIAEADPRVGAILESLMAGVASSDQEAKRRMQDFLEKRAAKVEHRVPKP